MLQAKTLAAKEVRQLKKLKKFHSDGILKNQCQTLNVLLRILDKNNTLQTVCLANDIFSENSIPAEHSER